MELGKKIEDNLGQYYKNLLSDPCSVLSLLSACKESVSEVSAKLDFGLSRGELFDLCVGYIFGTDEVKGEILDLMEDINFHREHAEIKDDAEGFFVRFIIGDHKREIDRAREEIWVLAGGCVDPGDDEERARIANMAFRVIDGSNV